MKQVFELKLELGSCNPVWACFSVWIVFFSPLRHQTLHWSWWGLQRITEQVGLYPEARGPPVGTSSHDVFNTNTVARGSLTSVVWPWQPCISLPSAPPKWTHEAQINIFVFIKIKKKVLFVCISTCQVLYFRIFFCNYCLMHRPGAVWRFAFYCHAFQLMISMH